MKFKPGDLVRVITKPYGVPKEAFVSNCLAVIIEPWNTHFHYTIRLIQEWNTEFKIWHCNDNNLVLADDLTDFERVMYGL